MSAPAHAWIYRARMVPTENHPSGVVDGDTLAVALEIEHDFGFGFKTATTLSGRLRLLGVNCPETTGPTKSAGMAAAWFTETWINEANAQGDLWPLEVETRRGVLRSVHEVDHFGRYLGIVTRVVDGHKLNTDLVTAGHAVEQPPY